MTKTLMMMDHRIRRSLTIKSLYGPGNFLRVLNTDHHRIIGVWDGKAGINPNIIVVNIFGFPYRSDEEERVYTINC